MPKQKPGKVGDWVLEEGGFVNRQHKSVSEHKGGVRVMPTHNDMTEKKKVFRKAIKKLAVKMRESNLSLK